MTGAVVDLAPRLDGATFLRTLVERGDLPESDARLAAEVARQNGASPVRTVVELGLLSEDALADRIAEACACPRFRADDAAGRALSDALPRGFMESNDLLVFDDAGDTPDTNSGEDPRPDAPPARTLVVTDPSDRMLLHAALGRLDGTARVMIGAHRDVQAILRDAERQSHDAARDHDAEPDLMNVAAEVSHLRDMASEAPVIRFFNQAVERAMDLGASDIHLERFDKRVALRVRVDGMLIDQPAPPTTMFDALICRLKIMAELDIAERRRAQDGRIRMRLRGRMVDLRVSLVPTLYGQDAVLRVQDRQRLGAINLEEIGFAPDQVRWLRGVTRKSHGIILITGPTGSGKTTTLYALLRTLVTTDRKIITVEDPVEYAMDGVNQIQANPALGVTFAGALRNVLRHDPDVVLIGEIRDAETARMAFQAALTGHLVLSTLHTNDVPGTFVRLIDMGVEPYLVNAVVEGVTAQRLLRATCASCRNEPTARESCPACTGLGYKGRVAIMEHSGLPAGVKRAIVDGADERRLSELLRDSGYVPMRERAAGLVARGVTDDAEIARVLGADDEIDDV